MQKYELSAEAVMDNTTNKSYYRKYLPDIAVSEGNTNITLNVRDTQDFVQLHDSFLEIKGNFSKADGTALVTADNHRVCLQAAGLLGCFETCRLSVSNKLVEDVQNAHINNFTKTLLTKSREYVDSMGENMNYVLDEGTVAGAQSQTATGADDITVPAGSNAGHARRRRNVRGLIHEENKQAYSDQDTNAVISYTGAVKLRDVFSFCEVEKVLKGAPVRIELTKRTGAECVLAGADNPKFVITDCNLWVKVVRPSLELLPSLEQRFVSGNPIPWEYLRAETFISDATTGANRSYTFTTLSQRPHSAFLFASSNTGTGSNVNNFKFDNMSMTSLRLIVNGENFPYQQYEYNATDWADNSTNVSRAYEELTRFMGKDRDEDSSHLITPRNFRDLYPIHYFGFDTLKPTASGYQLRVEMQNPAPGAATTLYLMVLSYASVQLIPQQGLVSVVQQ